MKMIINDGGATSYLTRQRLFMADPTHVGVACGCNSAEEQVCSIKYAINAVDIETITMDDLAVEKMSPQWDLGQCR